MTASNAEPSRTAALWMSEDWNNEDANPRHYDMIDVWTGVQTAGANRSVKYRSQPFNVDSFG